MILSLMADNGDIMELDDTDRRWKGSPHQPVDEGVHLSGQMLDNIGVGQQRHVSRRTHLEHQLRAGIIRMLGLQHECCGGRSL